VTSGQVLDGMDSPGATSPPAISLGQKDNGYSVSGVLTKVQASDFVIVP